MSLEINIKRITAVLLPDGEWHPVVDQSFEIDAYEYVEGGGKGSLRLGGGNEKPVPSTGASWVERGGSGAEVKVFCPITAILAVRYHIKGSAPLDIV